MNKRTNATRNTVAHRIHGRTLQTDGAEDRHRNTDQHGGDMRLARLLAQQVDESDCDEYRCHDSGREPETRGSFVSRRPRDCARDRRGCDNAERERGKIDGRRVQ